MTTNNIPEIPRTAFAHRKAINFISTLDSLDFPLDPLTALQGLDVEVTTYQEIMENCQISYEHLIQIGGSEDGFSRYMPSLQRYCVAYNDAVTTVERQNWTLAHELGHVILGHFTDFSQARLDKTLYNSRQLSNHDAYVLDREADTFASDFLAPAGLIYWMACNYHLCTPIFYYSLARKVFFLSRQAAYVTSCNIERDKRPIYHYTLYRPLIKKFQPIWDKLYIKNRRAALKLYETSIDEYLEAQSRYSLHNNAS